ncbi:MAG: iron-sulfur cluster assembly protein [Muribaculaceae bacterium]|nr:iron-sulfur cluster assembly protein [Muribaculaceae bacterium]
MITDEQRLAIEQRAVEMLKTVYDPEIPVDIYNLGLIYKIEVDDEAVLHVDMPLTAPNCPAADFLVEDARLKLESIDGVKSAEINIVFEPEWDKDMMSEEAKLDLGFL